MAEVKALIDGMVTVSDFMKPFTKVYDCLLRDLGQSWAEAPVNGLTPWEYAIPTEQTHEIVGAIGAKIVSISGVQEDIVSWNLLWMNSGPSSYDATLNAYDAALNVVL